nr:alveoline-like protein [Pinctada fucata]
MQAVLFVVALFCSYLKLFYFNYKNVRCQQSLKLTYIFCFSSTTGAAFAVPPKEIHLPAPKVKTTVKEAHQEHAVNVVQHVPIVKNVVRTVKKIVPVVQEVPIHIHRDLILKSPVKVPKVIDIKKTILQPHIRHVPVDKPYLVHRKVPVFHHQIRRIPEPRPRIVKIPRIVPITKVLNRIIEVPHIVNKVRRKKVIRPVPVVRTHVRKVHVPVKMRVVVPEPVIQTRHTQSVETVGVPQTVVRKVKIPKTYVLKDLVPVPEKAAGTVSRVASVVNRGPDRARADAAARAVIASNANIRATVTVGQPGPVLPGPGPGGAGLAASVAAGGAGGAAVMGGGAIVGGGPIGVGGPLGDDGPLPGATGTFLEESRTRASLIRRLSESMIDMKITACIYIMPMVNSKGNGLYRPLGDHCAVHPGIWSQSGLDTTFTYVDII